MTNREREKECLTNRVESGRCRLGVANRVRRCRTIMSKKSLFSVVTGLRMDLHFLLAAASILDSPQFVPVRVSEIIPGGSAISRLWWSRLKAKALEETLPTPHLSSNRKAVYVDRKYVREGSP